MAVFNVFRMYALMGPERLSAMSSAQVALTDIIDHGVRGAPDVGVLATRAPHQLAIMVWHYHDDDLAGPDAAVALAVAGLPAGAAQAKLTHYRIDQTHSNPYAEWLRMGSPVAPNEKQYAALQQSSQLATLTDAPATIAIKDGAAQLAFALPRQAVSLLVLEW
jgi:xylan 1,4-beta-xylosidase